MKTFEELTPEQKEKAIVICVNNILHDIIECNRKFKGLQARINKAWKEAERMKTPWFVHEYIMDTCEDDIKAMAETHAQNSLYPEPQEHVIDNVIG